MQAKIHERTIKGMESKQILETRTGTSTVAAAM
jgi:hypothetical protein